MAEQDCYMVGAQKREAPGDHGLESPKRGREETITLAAIQAMLQQQTAEIKKQAEENRKAQLSDLKEIAKNMELTTKRQVDEIKNEMQLVKREVGTLGEDIKQVQTQMQKLENRLMVVESRALSSAAASTTGTEPDRSLSVIMGGWPRDTKKDDLLKFGKDALRKIDATRYLDSDPFATGLRRGFLLSNP